jgi:hypothetical protein
MSLYWNFLARGQEVIFPKDMGMEVALAGGTEKSASSVVRSVAQRFRHPNCSLGFPQPRSGQN